MRTGEPARAMIVIALLLVPSLSAFAPTPPEPPRVIPSPQDPPPDLEVTVLTDKRLYRAGDPVRITIRVTNHGDTVTLHFLTLCQADFRVEDPSGSVWYNNVRHHPCLQALSKRTWLPGQTHDYHVWDINPWNQMDDEHNQVPAHSEYVIRGFLVDQVAALSGHTMIWIGRVGPGMT